MIINITGKGTTVKDSFKETIESKLAKFDRFFDDDAVADVKVTRESVRETVEVTIHSHGMYYRSESTTDDRLDSLDQVVDKLFRIITKNKSKLNKRLKKVVFDDPSLTEYIAPDHKEEDYKIIRSKQFTLKPMYTDEAILHMNMLGHDFFMFRNAETNEVSVVYKRKDSNYGLIEPIAD